MHVPSARTTLGYLENGGASITGREVVCVPCAFDSGLSGISKGGQRGCILLAARRRGNERERRYARVGTFLARLLGAREGMETRGRRAKTAVIYGDRSGHSDLFIFPGR